MAQITIRPMTGTDISLLAGWIPDVPLWQRYQVTPEIAIRHLSDALARADLLLVADAGPQAPAAGFAWCMPQGGFGRSAYLRWIGVSNTHTGSGLGSLLLEQVEHESAVYTTDLFLLVSDFNEAAQRFYRRSGYSQIGALPAYVLPDVDELIFWKRLRQADQ